MKSVEQSFNPRLKVFPEISSPRIVKPKLVESKVTPKRETVTSPFSQDFKPVRDRTFRQTQP